MFRLIVSGIVICVSSHYIIKYIDNNDVRQKLADALSDKDKTEA